MAGRGRDVTFIPALAALASHSRYGISPRPRNRSLLEDFGARSIAKIEPGTRYREALPHRRVIFSQIARLAAILERQAVGIFEINRLRPAVVRDLRDLDALGAQLVALVGQGRRRAGLECKMIERGWNAKPTIDAGIVRSRHVRDAARLQKGEELTTSDVEKYVPEAAAFFDPYHVGDDLFKAQDVLVKFTGLVQVKGRKADVRNASMAHRYYSSG